MANTPQKRPVARHENHTQFFSFAMRLSPPGVDQAATLPLTSSKYLDKCIHSISHIHHLTYLPYHTAELHLI